MGRRREDRNEYGDKNKVRIRINGTILARQFRNEGEARKYLTMEGFTKDDLKKGFVKILFN
jgi:hypothetical protein